MSAVQDDVGVLQLRVLIVIASRGALTLSELAGAIGLHLSGASRTCERMSQAGLIDRSADPADRRNLRLTLTADGRQIVAEVARTRRAAIAPALGRMSAAARCELVSALHQLTTAAGEPDESDLWALGWAT